MRVKVFNSEILEWLTFRIQKLTNGQITKVTKIGNENLKKVNASKLV